MQRHQVQQRPRPSHVEERDVAIAIAHGGGGLKRMRGDACHVIGRVRVGKLERFLSVRRSQPTADPFLLP